MQWIEQTDGPVKPDDFFDFPYEYWMDETDPKESKRLSLEHFKLDGGGDY